MMQPDIHTYHNELILCNYYFAFYVSWHINNALYESPKISSAISLLSYKEKNMLISASFYKNVDIMLK